MSSNNHPSRPHPATSTSHHYEPITRSLDPSPHLGHPFISNSSTIGNVTNSSRTMTRNAAKPAFKSAATPKPTTRPSTIISVYDKSDYQIMKEGGWDSKKEFMLCHDLWRQQDFEGASEILDKYRELDIRRERQEQEDWDKPQHCKPYPEKWEIDPEIQACSYGPDAPWPRHGFTFEDADGRYYYNNQTPPQENYCPDSMDKQRYRSDDNDDQDHHGGCCQEFFEDKGPEFHDNSPEFHDDGPEFHENGPEFQCDNPGYENNSCDDYYGGDDVYDGGYDEGYGDSGWY